MNTIPRSITYCGRHVALGVLCALSISTCHSSRVAAALLPMPAEKDDWSDMALPTGVTGNFNSATKTLSINGLPSNDLEIGAEFGPSNTGRHYGTSGTLGGPFSANLSVTGVELEADGTVTSGGTVTVTHEGSAPGSLADDYADTIHSGPLVADTNGGSNTTSDGDVLLSGTVIEVLLNANGDNRLEILFDITGGALQFDSPDPDVGVFAPNNRGFLRIAGVAMPNDWSSNFSQNGATIDVLGIPEPGALTLACLVVVYAWLARPRRSL
jgi:hypothetical protein